MICATAEDGEMTLLDNRPTATERYQEEALFQEARQRRRRRWALGAGIAILIAGRDRTPGPSHDRSQARF